MPDFDLTAQGFRLSPVFHKPTKNPLYLSAGDDPNALLRKYAAMLPRHRRTVPLRGITGWNSWDYYFQTVTEKDVIENLKAIKKHRFLADKLQYIILDDGWQNGYGDWETSSRFNGNLAEIVKRIHSAGFKAGIWTAPFIADYYSRLSLRHPEMLARNASGGYDFDAGGNGGIGTVDPTSPESEKMLYGLFRKLREAGFEYFKVDFIHHLLKPSQFHTPMRRMDIVTHGLEIIRNAIGPDAVLTGCGMPVAAGWGIVDSMRVSGDISTFWSNILVSARELSVSAFLNRSAWIADPDFLIVRNSSTSKETVFNPFFLPKPYQPFESRTGEAISSESKAAVWATLVILTGGSLILSDRLAMLNRRGLALLKTAMRLACTESAIPLDLMQSGIPAFWRCGGEQKLFAVFNWGDSPETFRRKVDFDSAREVWSGERVRFRNGIYMETLRARSVRLFEVSGK